MQPGIKTSELWITIIAGFILSYGPKIGIVLDSSTITAIATLVVTYVASRTIHKATNNIYNSNPIISQVDGQAANQAIAPNLTSDVK